MPDRRRWFLLANSIAFVLAALIFGLEGAGALNDFLHHLRHFTSAAGTDIKIRLLHFSYVVQGIVHPTGLYWFGYGFAAFVAWMTSTSTIRNFSDARRKYKERHDYESHGTAHFQNKRETDLYYRQDNKGFLIGDYQKRNEGKPYWPLPLEAFADARKGSYCVHPFTSNLNQQYLVYGSPGANKTTAYVLPNLFHLAQQGLSIVATDPKGELYKLSANFFRDRGYKVVVIDYLNFLYGSRQNLLHYAHDEEQIAELSSMYLTATQREGKTDPFFEEKAQQLLTGLLGAVKQIYGDDGTFTHVFEIASRVSEPGFLAEFMEEHEIRGAARMLLHSVLSDAKSEATLASIVATLTGRLQLFTISKVRAQSATSDYDIHNVSKEKTIIYIWMSVSHKTYAPLLSAFWTSLFNSFYKVAELNFGILPNPVAVIMEEMGNIGKIADFDVKLTTMRSLGVYPIMIWHSYPQLKDKYGENTADAIESASDTKIVLACGDLQTAEHISKILGDTTIETQSRRRGRTVVTEINNATNSFTGRRLLKPEELYTLDRKYSLVIQSGRPPALLNKAQYQHWEKKICPDATLEQLPRIPSIDEEPEYKTPVIQQDPDHEKRSPIEDIAVTQEDEQKDPDVELTEEANPFLKFVNRNQNKGR